jgi:hypothetical protein
MANDAELLAFLRRHVAPVVAKEKEAERNNNLRNPVPAPPAPPVAPAPAPAQVPRGGDGDNDGSATMRAVKQLALELHARHDVTEQLLLETLMTLREEGPRTNCQPPVLPVPATAEAATNTSVAPSRQHDHDDISAALIDDLARIAAERDDAMESARQHAAWSQRLEAELDLVLRDRFELEHGRRPPPNNDSVHHQTTPSHSATGAGAAGATGAAAVPPAPSPTVVRDVDLGPLEDRMRQAVRETERLRTEILASRDSAERSAAEAERREEELLRIVQTLRDEIAAMQDTTSGHRHSSTPARADTISMRSPAATVMRSAAIEAIAETSVSTTQTPRVGDGLATHASQTDDSSILGIPGEHSNNRSVSVPNTAANTHALADTSNNVDLSGLEDRVADAARAAVLDSCSSMRREHMQQVTVMRSELARALRRGDTAVADEIEDWMRRFANIERLMGSLMGDDVLIM